MARIRGDPSARDMSLRTASSMGELDEGKEQGGKSGHSERKLTDGAGGRTRTDTTFYGPRILSPVRLPFRHTGKGGFGIQPQRRFAGGTNWAANYSSDSAPASELCLSNTRWIAEHAAASVASLVTPP